jgi:pentatricopeptide repeat protein
VFEYGWKLFEIMKNDNVIPNIEIYNILIDEIGMNKKWNKIIPIFKEMKKYNLVNTKSCNMMITILKQDRQYKLACDICNEMKQNGIQHDTLVCFLKPTKSVSEQTSKNKQTKTKQHKRKKQNTQNKPKNKNKQTKRNKTKETKTKKKKQIISNKTT